MKIYILEKTQVEQVSVMNKLLNDALRAKGYKGPDIKMVLTDVEDPNGPYYTDKRFSRNDSKNRRKHWTFWSWS